MVLSNILLTNLSSWNNAVILELYVRRDVPAGHSDGRSRSFSLPAEVRPTSIIHTDESRHFQHVHVPIYAHVSLDDGIGLLCTTGTSYMSARLLARYLEQEPRSSAKFYQCTFRVSAASYTEQLPEVSRKEDESTERPGFSGNSIGKRRPKREREREKINSRFYFRNIIIDGLYQSLSRGPMQRGHTRGVACSFCVGSNKMKEDWVGV